MPAWLLALITSVFVFLLLRWAFPRKLTPKEIAAEKQNAKWAADSIAGVRERMAKIRAAGGVKGHEEDLFYIARLLQNGAWNVRCLRRHIGAYPVASHLEAHARSVLLQPVQALANKWDLDSDLSSADTFLNRTGRLTGSTGRV